LTSKPLAFTFAGLALLGGLVLGAYVYDRNGPPAAKPAPPVTPMSLPRYPEVAADAIPDTRPLFTLPDLDGKPHSVTEWDGKALVVNFWATWCAPCRREIPLLNRIQKEYAPKGVEVVGIAVDFADDVKAYMKASPIGYPVLVGEQAGIDAARDFGVSALAFPFTVFTDSKGRIVTLHLGELHESAARAILGVVMRVDSGALPASEARRAVEAALAALPADPKAPSG